MKHACEYRVYYEDTDAGGIMYHGNYINWCERARCEFLHAVGLSFSSLFEETQMLFVIRHIDAHYLKPALLDQILRIESDVKELKNSSFIMNQSIFCQDSMLFSMIVTVVCVDKNGRPIRVPETIRAKFDPYMNKNVQE